MPDSAGERDAILTERIWPVVVRIARGRSLRRDQADDLAQEAMLRVIQGYASWDGRAPLEHWAARIAVRVCIDAGRRSQRREAAGHGPIDGPERAVLVAARTEAPIDQVAGRELVDRLLEILAPRDRLAIHLLDLEGWSVAEVASALACSAIAVRVRAFRARRRLRRHLAKLMEVVPHGHPS